MDNAEFRQIAYEVARHHHEKYNGGGYPDGLMGEQIPLHARIMAIVTYKYIEKKDTLCFGEYHGVDLNGTFMKDIPEFLLLVKKEVWPRDVPDTIRSIPYYWELSPEQLEEHFNNMKKSDAFQPTQQEKEFCRILINDDDL